ncbi:YSIRK-type signal peptide-containing protein [Streptococcus suis]|uniref:YSIRK-type signal peptide-containing protein n=2 Tax=Streptococcus suis TaxID=1307 RepID=UPI000CF444A8
MLDKKKINLRRKRMTTPDKHYRYSIRKFNVGIASVAIAAFMFLGNGAVSVSANELASNEEVIPTSGPVSEEDLSSSAEIKESELVPSSTPNTGTPAETPAQTEKVVAEETVPVTENADSLPTNQSQQESLSTKESDDALAAAKKVLEEVISEAEVLSADALRKAAKSTADTSSLQSAANATKAAAEIANQVFADEHASLEEVNAQITAIRTAVGNLVPELTSFTGTEEVTVMLAATTSGAADANQSGIDAISANNGQYTAISVTQNFKWTDIEENPIIALKMADGTYKYKKFSGTVTVDRAKAAKDEFVDAATYKTANGPLQAGDKVYIIQESDFTSAPTSIEESYDLTKFHHRENMILAGWSISPGITSADLADPDADADSSALIALARPGSFESEIEFKDANHPGEPSIYLPKENNTVLVADSISEALRQEEPSYKNFGLFLSHIAVNDDKVNKPNTVMELPKGVEVVFADQNDQPTTFAEAMNEIMAALQYDTDEWTILNPQQKLKFKFIVKKDGVQIQEDADWREITLHVYNDTDVVKGMVKTTLTNTPNDFEAGIVDNIDFSGLPEEMKNEAIEMEKTYRNVDGTLPQDGQLPEFSNPDNKRYDWVVKVGEESDGTHATSPARYFPYDMGLFQGEGDKINKKLLGYIPYIQDYKPGNGDDLGIAPGIAPSEHDKKLVPYYPLGSVFTRTMFDRNFTPEPGGVNGSYWHSLTQAMPIPQLDFEPEVNLDIVTLSDNPQPNPKGTVKIVYKALNADGTDVDSSVVLRADVTDTEDAAVGTPWNAKETGVDHDKDTATDSIDERPETFTTQATETNPSREYKLVSAKTTVQTPTDAAPVTVTDDAQLEGKVIEGTTTVTYYYALVQEQPATSREVKGDVIIKYEDTAGTEIKGQLKDTDQGVVATYTTPSRRYIKVDNQVTYLDSEPAETVELSNLAYNADQTREDGTVEKPATIESAGKTYRFIKLKDDSATVTGLVTEATKTVTYVYAPEQTRQVPTPSNGSVIVEYKLEGSETPEKPEGEKLQADFNDTTDQLVSTSTVTETYYVDANGKEQVTNISEPVVTLTNATYEVTKAEAPDILTIGEKTYHKVRVNGTENGTLPAGETKVTYYYAEEQVEEGVIEEKGNVTVKYETEGGAPLKSDYKDSENVLVSSTPTTRRYYLKDGKKVYLDEQPVRGTTTKTDATYDTREDKSATGGVNEKPATLTDESGTTYHLIKTKDETPENGTLPAGDTVVTYVYAPEQTEIIPTENKAKVTVNYYILGTSTPLQPSYEDTPATKISETVTTNTYYLDANNERVPVGDPAVVINPVDPAVSYDTTETKNGKEERPTTLKSGDKTYHLVEAATTFTEGTGVSGTLTKDTVVNYYYAEIKDEVTTEPTNGSVTIKYETTDGTPLRDDKEDTASTVISTKTTTKKYYEYDGQKVYVGDPVESTETKDLSYDTTEADKDEKPETLQKDGKTYQRVAVKAGSADENGKVTGDHVVTYVYAEIKDEVTTEPTNGSVTIKYETTDGTPLRDDKEDTASTVISAKTTTKKYYVYDGQKVYVGDPVESTETKDLSYDTTEADKDEKPETLQKGDKTYQLVAVKADSAAENGKVTGDHVVTYVYAEIKEEVNTERTNGSVTIKYESTDGTPLRDDKEDTASTVISTKTTTKKYYEYDGQKVYVGDPVESTETVDLSYNTTEADKDEKPSTLEKDDKTYQLVAVKAGSADENGKVTGDHVVTYVYAEIKEEVTTEPTNGSVTIKYETTDGTPLRDDKEDTASTVISTKTTTKKYYEYDGQKVYVGDPVESTETKDLSYDTTEADKDEKPETLQKGDKTYQLVAVKAGSADENGKVTGDHVVTYVYAEIKEEVNTERTNGSVTIKYETVDGKELQSPFPDTPSTEISSITTKRKYYEYNGVKTYVGEAEVTPSTKDVPYNTTEDNEKPETLQKGGKTYQLVAVKAGSADENGKVTGDHVVTYVYAEVPEEPKPEEPKPEEPKPEEPKPEEPKPEEPKPEEPKPEEPKPEEPKPEEPKPEEPKPEEPKPEEPKPEEPKPEEPKPEEPKPEEPKPEEPKPEEPKPEEPKPEEPKPEEPKPEEPKPGEPTPPTDGGVNPPTDGGTTPPTDGGVNPPTDGGTTPPTDGGVNPPTDGGTTPPTDGGVNPPTDGGTTPPTDGGTTPPTDGGTTPPTDGGTTPPTDGGTTPPTDGGVNPPTDGGTTPPIDGGTTPPTDGGVNPPTDGGTTPPTDGGVNPSTDGGVNPPTDGGTTPPIDGGTTPPTDGGTTPPTDGGTTPPTDGGTTPPTDGGTTPPTDGGTTPPTDGGTIPPTDGGTTPPTDGGTTPTPTTGTITVTPKAGTAQLPNTGEASTSPLYGVLAFATGLAGLFGLVKKKKEEDQ